HIDGGSDNDTLFGDDGRIGSLAETGLATIDREIAGLSVSMRNLQTDFASLAFAGNALDAVGSSQGMQEVSAGNDTILGGLGDDTIFGDTGMIVLPGSAIPLAGADTTAAALRLHAWLMDFQTVTADLSYAAHAAGEHVL